MISTTEHHTNGPVTTLVDQLLAEQRTLTAVERFSQHHDRHVAAPEEKFYRALMPARAPGPGEQYAFEVDLDACSGCKACVAGCHSMNGLSDNETWREVGLLIGTTPGGKQSVQQTITAACHHCADPGCLNGCPVKAYDKDPDTGIVRHLDDQCIGCQYCVMKCPYEVPKFSAELGIVRKCDMCVNRLAVGEAPACVQSCPNGAIKISIVKPAEIKARFQVNGHSATATGTGEVPLALGDSLGEGAASLVVPNFLPDSPSPRITFPTTRYISRRGLQNLFAADHAAPRLDQPHWPLVVMLVFTQAAVGMFLAATVAPLSPVLLLAAFALLNVGLAAAPLHLGRPLKAWRAFLGWRTSWLSREIIVFNLFAPPAALATALAWLPFLARQFPIVGESLHKLPAWVPPLDKLPLPLALGSALVGLGCVFVSGMVYVDTKRACWSPRHSFGAFFGTTLLLGTTFAAVVFASASNFNTARLYAVAALVIRTALFAWRRFEVRSAARNPQSPIYLNARAMLELLPWSPATQMTLFVASTVFGLMAITDIAGFAAVWAGAAAMTTLISEIVARHLFFRAGAGKKMPGLIAA